MESRRRVVWWMGRRRRFRELLDTLILLAIVLALAYILFGGG